MLPFSFLLCMHVAISPCSPLLLLPSPGPGEQIWSLSEVTQIFTRTITLVLALVCVGKEILMVRRGWLAGEMGSSWELEDGSELRRGTNK